MSDLYKKHMDDIMTGEFSSTMMEDWADGDKKLLTWREETGASPFETTPAGNMDISEQEYFDNGLLMVAMTKAGVELAFETMTDSGIKAESAYYESLHEVPLIANLISRKKTLRNEQSHLGYRRIRLLPFRKHLCALTGGFHERYKPRLK